MKNGNLYQKLKSAKKNERVAWAKRYAVELEMMRELEEATSPIKEKYEPILKEAEKEISTQHGKVWDVAWEYHKYGSFFTKNIVDIFAVLLSYIEGEKFIPYRDFDNLKITEGSIIIRESVYKQCDEIDYDVVDQLYNNGDLVMLSDGFSNMVNFYNNIGEPNYYFGQFNYLHEFVNRLIQYRIDNGKKDEMFMEELYSFMCNFISTHPNLALKNKEKREQMLMEQSEEEIISECKRLKMKLE